MTPSLPDNIPARKLLRLLAPFLGLAIVYLVFAVLEPATFPTAGNFRVVLTQTVNVALGALGMTLVIIAAGIDLSIGSVMALTTVVTALLVKAECPTILAVLAGVTVGGLCGAANGLLPCGLVYASLGIPVAAADPVVGALAMTAFGLGTIPALTAVAMGLRRIVMRDIRLRRALAAAVVMAALWSIGARTGVLGGDHMHHGPGMEDTPGMEHPLPPP